jgi:hypothetical protein
MAIQADAVSDEADLLIDYERNKWHRHDEEAKHEKLGDIVCNGIDFRVGCTLTGSAQHA